jgi:hypothetical protein
LKSSKSNPWDESRFGAPKIEPNSAMNRQLQKVQTLPSLIIGEHEQEPSPEELQADLDAAYASLEPAKEYTGAQLFRCNRRAYMTAVKMAGEGLSTRLIAFACGVSPGTVEAVRTREKLSIETEKERILNTVRSVVRVSAERMLEVAHTTTPKEASIMFGIACEKMLLLSGEPSVIVGKEEQLTHRSFNDLIAALPVASAQVIEPSNCQQVGEAAKEGQ